MILEVILYFLTELLHWDVFILEPLDEVLNFNVLILFVRLLREIDQLFSFLALLMVLLQERAPLVFIKEVEKLLDFLLIV